VNERILLWSSSAAGGLIRRWEMKGLTTKTLIKAGQEKRGEKTRLLFWFFS